MFALTNKPDMGARLYTGLIELASCPNRGVDAMKVMQHMAGVLVETYLMFEDPGDAMEASFDKLSKLLGAEPLDGDLADCALPPAYMMDFETEQGRQAARIFFEEWLDCLFEFHDLMIAIAHNVIVSWEEHGQPRAESFRLLIECTRRCLAYEISAQELCDLVIESKVAQAGWSLGDCIAALSSVAGRKTALSHENDVCMLFRGADVPDNLDHIVYVMTQEAVRLGVPAGTDWRFGLAANDMPINAPIVLLRSIEPQCTEFFDLIGIHGVYDRAVACAKAAGRMIAVAAGGDLPEIEPAIAKPLAMAAITETYKHVCMDVRLHAN